MKPFLRYATAPVLSAILLACSFPPLHAHYLAWVALVPLLWACHGRTPRQSAGRFFLAGWLFHALLLHWLAANVFWAGFRALIGWQLLSLYLALYWAALGALHGWLGARLTWRFPTLLSPALLVLPFLWVVMEWAQATLFTGLGWSALGYAQAANLYFVQWAAVGGVSLLGFILLSANILIAGAARHHWRWALPAAVVVGAAHGCGYLLLEEPNVTSDSPKVAIFQSSFSQSMKWDPTFYLEMVQLSAQASLAAAAAEDPDIIIWPEALVLGDYRTQAHLSLLQRTTVESGAFLMTGTDRRGDHGEYFNSSLLMNPEGEVTGTYDKMHLAPFGEYVPFARYWPVLDQLVPGGAVDAGEGPVVLDAASLRLGPLICFEVVFGPMAERLRRDGANALVVMTNLAWFGASGAVAQELEAARLRAVETRLPLLHAANTGISAVIDPWGRVQGPNADINFLAHPVYRRRATPPEPVTTLLQRMFAVHRVPEASKRPILSVPPWVTPWVCMAISLAVIAMALPRRGKGEPADGA